MDWRNWPPRSRRDGSDPEVVNAVFRAVHSIKGGAAAFGLEALVRFAHQFETVLDEVRSGRLAASAGIINVSLRSADHLADLVASARDETQPNTSVGAELLKRLEQLVTPAGSQSPPAEAEAAPELPGIAEFQPIPLALDFAQRVSKRARL